MDINSEDVNENARSALESLSISKWQQGIGALTENSTVHGRTGPFLKFLDSSISSIVFRHVFLNSFGHFGSTLGSVGPPLGSMLALSSSIDSASTLHRFQDRFGIIVDVFSISSPFAHAACAMF